MSPDRFSDQVSEKAVLSCIMHAPHHALVIAEQAGCNDEWFSQNAMHRTMYSMMREFVVNGNCTIGASLDAVVFTKFLRDKGVTTIGFSELSDIYTFMATAVNVRQYIEAVRDMYVLRVTRSSCSEILELINSGTCSAATAVSELSFAAASVGITSAGGQKRKTTASAVDEIMADIEGNNDVAIFGRSTGYSKLDEIIGGFQQGDMILIRGARGSGKSAFALNLAEAFDRKHSLGTAYYTYEMTVRQQVSRLIQLCGRQNIKDYVRGRSDLLADKSGLGLIKYGADRVRSSKIEFREDRPATIDSIVQKTRVAASAGGLGLAVLDYDELLTLPPKMSKEEGLSEISSEWKKVAGELGITTILLSQVTEGKDGNVKARWSQAKENFANIILTVAEKEDGSRTVSIDKNRDGSRGDVVEFDFLGKICMFTCR